MASPDELRTREIVDEHLPGYAELCAELAPANPNSDTLSRVLQERAKELGLPAVGGRGVPSALRPLVDFLQRRRLIDDLGNHNATVTWLELHVPRGGSGAVKWRTAGTGQAAFSLELLGSGLGSGRKTSWVVESDVPRRSTCLRFVQEITARIKVYSVSEQDRERLEPAVDIVGTRGRRLESWPDCPFCAIGMQEVDEFAYERGDVIDLTAYDAEYSETYQREVSFSRNVDLGLKVPISASLPQAGTVGLSLKQETTMSYEVAYQFINGRCYQPYWPADEPVSLPYWSAG
jgi:hypothetical protein